MRATLMRSACLASIVEKQRLGAALALVVAGARTDRIDVAPIILGLGMNSRVAVDLRRRGLENFRTQALGEAQHVDCAVHARLRRLHRVVLVVHRRCRAGKIVDFVDFDIERKRHVVPHQLEALFADEVRDVALRTGEEVVDADHVAPSAIKRSHRCEPRNPAPPVTRIRFSKCMTITPRDGPRVRRGCRPRCRQERPDPSRPCLDRIRWTERRALSRGRRKPQL